MHIEHNKMFAVSKTASLALAGILTYSKWNSWLLTTEAKGKEGGIRSFWKLLTTLHYVNKEGIDTLQLWIQAVQVFRRSR